jgi:hypothetical protein
LAATIVEGELQLVPTIVDKRTSGAAPWMPINTGIRLRANCERRECESEVTRRREKEELLPWAAALLPYAAECVNWELSDPPPCIVL